MEPLIPFNWPHLTGNELRYIAEAQSRGQLAGDGPFTKMCHQWLERQTDCNKALLTHSCTAALEMAALLLDIKPGDEIIMPSYTFVSTANAFVLRGGVPVFVDVREDTLNLDEKLIEAAITQRTRAILPVHYAGVGCEMDAIIAIARKHGLKVIEDAAQGIMSSYKGQPLGGIGDLGVFSFHETKNIISGEGGALVVNNPEYALRSEIIREKGTDRSRFFRGEVDKYTWQDVGSSFLPGELIAAFLWAQLQDAQRITEDRIASWEFYHKNFERLEINEAIRRPVVPSECKHNGHMYYVLLPRKISREKVLGLLRKHKISAVFHYVPLHNSVAGKQFGRAHESLEVTTDISERIIRLPLWVGITREQQERVIAVLSSAIL